MQTGGARKCEKQCESNRRVGWPAFAGVPVCIRGTPGLAVLRYRRPKTGHSGLSPPDFGPAALQ